MNYSHNNLTKNHETKEDAVVEGAGEDGLAVRSDGCSCTGPKFGSQHPYWELITVCGFIFRAYEGGGGGVEARGEIWVHGVRGNMFEGHYTYG